MKKLSIFSMALFTGAFAFVACNNTPSAKNPDSEKVASEANDQKIETNTFEKDADALVKLASQGHYLSAAASYAIRARRRCPGHGLPCTCSKTKSFAARGERRFLPVQV